MPIAHEAAASAAIVIYSPIVFLRKPNNVESKNEYQWLKLSFFLCAPLCTFVAKI